MATFAKPGDILIYKTSSGVVKTRIISNNLHVNDDGELETPHVPWDRFDIEGVYELAEESVVDRILTKYEGTVSVHMQ